MADALFAVGINFRKERLQESNWKECEHGSVMMEEPCSYTSKHTEHFSVSPRAALFTGNLRSARSDTPLPDHTVLAQENFEGKNEILPLWNINKFTIMMPLSASTESTQHRMETQRIHSTKSHGGRLHQTVISN